MNAKKGIVPHSLREHNRKIILEYLQKNGTTSVINIAKQTNISRQTVKKIIDELIPSGLVVMDGKGSSTAVGGKIPWMYALSDQIYFVNILVKWKQIAIYVTNTRLETVEFALSSERELDTVDVFEALLDEARKQLTLNDKSIFGIVVSVPGLTESSDSGVLVVSANFMQQSCVDLRVPIKKKFPNVEHISFYNDGLLTSIGQVYLHNCSEKRTLVLHIGDGVAGGIIDRGRILTEKGGAFGHIKVDTSIQEICSCGGHGCFEQAIGSNAPNRWKIEHLEEFQKSKFAALPESEYVIDRIFKFADEGDDYCQKFLEQMAEYYYIAISSILCSIGSDIVIITGDYGKNSSYFQEAVIHRCKSGQRISRLFQDVELIFDGFGVEQSENLGASLLLSKQLFK